MLGLLQRFNDREHVNRLFNTVESRYDDLGVRFNFGLPNPDFPALIRRRVFVLDIDAYVQGAQDRNDIVANMDRAHDRIQQLFEESITDELRTAMKPVNAA